MNNPLAALKLRWALPLAALAGLLEGTYFAGWHHPAVPFFALLPLLIAVRGRPWRHRFLLGWLAGIMGFALATHWVFPALEQLQSDRAARVPFYFLLNISYHGLQFGLFALGAAAMSGAVSSGSPYSPLRVGALWALIEWSFPAMLPWNRAQATLDRPEFAQLSSIVGVHGVAALTIAFNCVAANLLFRTSFKTRWRDGAGLVGLLLIPHLIGGQQIRSAAQTDGRRLSVAVVQAALPVGEKDPMKATRDSWETYHRETLALVGKGLDLVVWPETTLRVYLRNDPVYRPLVQAIVNAIGAPLLVDSLDLTPSGTPEFNAAYLIDPSGAEQVYYKQHLMPFGEYIPGASTFAFLRKWQTTGDFLPGPPTAPMRVSNTDFATSICLEVTRSGLNNESIQSGAGFLTNLTDDGWFRSRGLFIGHLDAARLRAIETRRWLIRSSNSGISAIIDPSGRLVASADIGARKTLVAQIATRDDLTLFVRFGHWVIPIFCMGVLWPVFARLRRHDRRSG